MWSSSSGTRPAIPIRGVRAVAIAALVNTASRSVSSPVWRQVARDPDPRVRRRAAEVAPKLGRAAPGALLVELLHDDDAWVAEAAAYAIGRTPAPFAAPRSTGW